MTVELTPRPDEAVVGVATAGTHPALFLYDPRPIWRALSQKWDVIDIHEEPFALATAEILLLRALRRVRTPVVLYTAQNLSKRYPLPFRMLERWTLRSAAGIAACNAEAAAVAVQKGFAGRPRVIALGVDSVAPLSSAEGDATSSDAEASGGVRPIIVGLLGRIVAEKGALVLLDALAGDARLRARIVGSGPLAAELPRLAAARGLSERVEVLPPVSHDELGDFYRSIDVLAVPSLPTPRWTEQFGRVAVEAMTAGVPVVASDAGALPEVVGDAGIIVPHGDATALSSALLAAAGPRRAELRARGRDRARLFSWHAVADDYMALYDSVIRRPGDGTPPAVEVIVVAYGAEVLLRRALEPIAQLPVTVVDNSSSPTIQSLCDELGVRYLDAGSNRGFAGAVNLGLEHRRDPDADVLLLNPDARIAPGQIDALQARLHADPHLASVAPRQTDGTGAPARVAWPFPTPGNAWLEAIGLAKLQRGPGFVIGSILLLRAEALDQIGGFDERFFLYAEETDWAYRAQRLGWHHRVVGEVTAEHIGAGTSTDESLRMLRFHASQERFHRKHFGTAGWQLARAGMLLGAGIRSVLRRGDRARQARSRASLLATGPLRAAARREEKA